MKKTKRLFPSRSILIVLIICLIGLTNITIRSQEKPVCLDSNQVKAVELLINNNEMLEKVNRAQGEQIELHKANESLLNLKVVDLNSVIKLKEQQIKELEGIRIPVIQQSNPDWWKFGIGGAVIGGLIYYIFDKVIFKK